MNDDELRQTMSLLEAYRTRVETMTRQVQILRASLDEVSLALDAVKAFKDAKVGDEIMVPVGASCYIPVQVTGNRTVITGIGSGISVQKTSDESIEYLESNAYELSEALKKSVSTLDELQKNLSIVNETVQNEYRARQQAGATGGY